MTLPEIWTVVDSSSLRHRSSVPMFVWRLHTSLCRRRDLINNSWQNDVKNDNRIYIYIYIYTIVARLLILLNGDFILHWAPPRGWRPTHSLAGGQQTIYNLVCRYSVSSRIADYVCGSAAMWSREPWSSGWVGREMNLVERTTYNNLTIAVFRPSEDNVMSHSLLCLFQSPKWRFLYL